MNISKSVACIAMLCLTLCAGTSCRKHGGLILGFADNDVSLSTADPLVCLEFDAWCDYSPYLFDGNLPVDSLNFSFLQRDDLYYLLDWNDLPPEAVYDVDHVDSNIVFCHFKPEYQRARYGLIYRNLRTDVDDPDAVDNRDYLSGYYSYYLHSTYPTEQREEIFGAKLSELKDSTWLRLYQGPLNSYYQKRLEREQNYQRKATEHSLRSLLHRIVLKRERPALPLAEAMHSCYKATIKEPLLYLPFPLDSTAYIFDKGLLERFGEDTIYCGKKNFYATYYELPANAEKLCRIISYDSNGLLAEMLPRANESEYRINLIPENGEIARCHLSNSEPFARRLRRRRPRETTAVWNDVRAADTVSIVMQDYDPQVFINAFPLIEAYTKSEEFRKWKDDNRF